MINLETASPRTGIWKGPLKPFDASGQFRFSADGGLRRLAVRGAGVTVFSYGLGLVIQMIGTVVLARLLTPADFGVVAMVTTFSLLLMSFGLNGFTEAIIQREEIDPGTVSNLFWINVGAGVVLTVAFAAAGSLLAAFYRDPLVRGVTIGIAPTILLASTSYTHRALLKRAIRFTETSAIRILAFVVCVTLAIALALAGWGYWALVAWYLAYQGTEAVGAWILCRWVPSLPRRAAGTGSMVRFALHVYGRFSLRYFSRNLDKLLVGWQFSAVALGFYKKAYDLFARSVDQVVAPLDHVALATLSRLIKDPVRYRRYVVNALAVVAFVGMGLSADLALAGKDVIRLVLGPQWGEAGTIFVFFGPGIGVMLLHSTCGWIHLSLGKPERWLRWTILEFAVMALLFFLGLRWGPEGIAAAWTASFWILTVPAFWYAGRPIRFGVSPLIGATWKYAAASLLAGGASAWILDRIPSLVVAATAATAFEGIVVISVLFFALYLGAVVLFHRGFDPLREFASILRELAPSRKTGTPALAYLWEKAEEHVRAARVRLLYRRPLVIRTDVPIISFTFDDFPRSAAREGARILKSFGLRGTYYASLGLIGKSGPPGSMFLLEDLQALSEEGHELGCHTFSHCHSWTTPPEEFEKAIIENRQALSEILPSASFTTFAFPKSMPRPRTKRLAAKFFLCCRGGFNTLNSGTADLNFLRAYFLEQARGDSKPVRELIQRNRRERGWLIFATHDICDSPSHYGCTPAFFENIVRYAADSGARILPVARACEVLQANAISR